MPNSLSASHKVAACRDHPLQLDVIERCLTLWSNPKENILTPFMGVGSEVCGAIVNDRLGIGVELKPSYYRQAIKNIQSCLKNGWGDGATNESLEFKDEEPETVSL